MLQVATMGKMSQIKYFFVIASSLLCVIESNGIPGTPIHPQYHENESGSASVSASGSGSGSGSGFGSASGSGSGSGFVVIPDFFYPFGEDVGDTRLQPIDDGSSKGILLNVPVVFYGRSELLAYVSSNGILSFQEEFSNCCPPRDFPRFSVPLIAPFWHDINIIAGGNIYYRQTVDTELIDISRELLLTFNITPPNFAPTNLLVVTWERVAPFSSDVPLEMQSNTFQLVLTTDGVISSAFFFYGDIQWGEAAQIGFNAGDGVNSFSLPGALTDDTVDIEEQSNVGHLGIYAYRIDDLTVIPTSEPPTDPTTTELTTSSIPSPITTTMVPTTVSTESPPSNPFFAPFGLNVGDQLVHPGDDISEGPILLKQSFSFFGKDENDAYVGTNGVISFQQSHTVCCEPRDFPQGHPPLIAPFWHDVNTINGGNIFYRQTSDPQLLLEFRLAARIHSFTFNPDSIFVVTWDRVAPFTELDTDEGLTNSFQVWLGADERESFVLFVYGDIQWGENAQIGFNAGDNVRSFSVSEALTADTVDIDLRSNINKTGVFLFRVDNLSCPPGTFQPQLQGDCLPCPLNTNRSVVNATMCHCLQGYFRSIFEGPEFPCTQPPSACRNIRAISVKEKNISISWEIPANTGRDDFYYTVEYTDGESVESDTVFSQNRVVQYSIDGLKPATDYIITVTVENGVSDQDSQNEYLRRCELRLTTQEGRPSPPIDVQSLCNVIVWGTPLNPNGDITRYEAQFYIPGTEVALLKEIAQDRTFYIVEEEDKLRKPLNTLVRVRARTRTGPGEWSAGKSLECDDLMVPQQTCPPCDCSTCETPTTPTPSVYFTLAGQFFPNNSLLSLSEIGEGADALLCKTNLINCCATLPNRFGQFYYPNGVMVPINSRAHGLYRDRGDQIVRLNRREGITSPKGTFRCEIRDADGIIQNLYITLA